MRTLSISKTIRKSILGTAYLSPKYQSVQIGKSVPTIQSEEDARVLTNCGFLDSSVPIGVNLLKWRPIQATLLQRRLEIPADGALEDPATLVSRHPVVGYVPPEVFCEPTSIAVGALSDSGLIAKELAILRSKSVALGRVEDRKWRALTRKKHFVGDSTFWLRSSSDRTLYSRFVSELISHGAPLGLSVLAAPVPVLQRRFPNSADLQGELNHACAEIVRPGTDPRLESGLLYSFHLEANVFQEKGIVRRAVDVCGAQLKHFGDRFWGIHISFVNLDRISQVGGAKVQAAVDLVDELVGIANEYGKFVWINGVGPVGAFMLDRGVSFTSYPLNGGMKSEYTVFRVDGGNPPSPELIWARSFGQTLSGPWSLSLRSRQEMEEHDWKVEDNDRTPPEVPLALRRDPGSYRVQFGKANNVGVMEKLNEERERELVVRGNGTPGSDAVGRSQDAKVRVWAR